MPKKNKDAKMIHDHAWNHFALYAKQRIDLFQYYIVFISVFAGAYHVTEQKIFTNNDFLGVFLAFVLFFVTAIFQFLDIRNHQLAQTSRNALIRFEKEFIEDKEYWIFTNDKLENIGTKYMTVFGIKISHYNCFKSIWFIGYSISLLWLCFDLHKLFFG